MGPHRKPAFRYSLPLVGHVSRKCWILCAGYQNANNGRVRGIEARIRKGEKCIGVKLHRRHVTNATAYCKAFMREYIFRHSQSSPSDTIKYVDFCGIKELHARYMGESSGTKKLRLSSFTKLWNTVLCEGVTDHETSCQYEVNIRKNRAKGFKTCNKCSYLKTKIAGTSSTTKRAAHERELQKHIDNINDDRETLARIQRLCITSKQHCGFYIDAADSAKFGIPTTQSTAKILSQLWRIRQKLTCVQQFDEAKSLHIFRTLPNVPTGGNMTATILMRMLKTGAFRDCKDLWINVDGAGDNICYTLYYYVISHILLCARKHGWSMERVHLLRMKVGHTHNELDATFAILSQHVYGKNSRGDARKNILSLAGFKEVCVHTYACTHTHTHTHTPSVVQESLR